jgi:hypothetical protein
VYVLNRCLTKSVDAMTLFEMWHGKKPTVHNLRTFGCIVYIQNMMSHLKKLEDRGCKMIFIGYESVSKAYHVYDPVTKCVHVACDMVFDEQAQWDWALAVMMVSQTVVIMSSWRSIPPSARWL